MLTTTGTFVNPTFFAKSLQCNHRNDLWKTIGFRTIKKGSQDKIGKARNQPCPHQQSQVDEKGMATRNWRMLVQPEGTYMCRIGLGCRSNTSSDVQHFTISHCSSRNHVSQPITKSKSVFLEATRRMSDSKCDRLLSYYINGSIANNLAVEMPETHNNQLSLSSWLLQMLEQIIRLNHSGMRQPHTKALNHTAINYFK